MSKRTEASIQMQNEIQTSGRLILTRGEEAKTIKALEEATKRYHDTREDTLKFALASAYGIGIWGSARIKPSSRYGKLVRDFVEKLIEVNHQDEAGRTIPLRIVTGSGPGLMEAANYGAHRAIEKSRNNESKVTVVNYGVPIQGLPKQGHPNRFIQHNGEAHPEFSTRKQRMLDLTRGIFIAAGGYGTLYEAFMAIQNKQTGYIESDYLIVAHHFWQEALEGINDRLYGARVREKQVPLISETDLRLVKFVKRPEEAIEIFTPSIRQWWRNIGRWVTWVD